jgi:hypothetical protein
MSRQIPAPNLFATMTVALLLASNARGTEPIDFEMLVGQKKYLRAYELLESKDPKNEDPPTFVPTELHPPVITEQNFKSARSLDIEALLSESHRASRKSVSKKIKNKTKKLNRPKT